METAEQYLEHYRRATDLATKRGIMEAYKTYLKTLTEAERNHARDVMSALWPDIRQRVEELEPMMNDLEAMTTRLTNRTVSA